MKKLRGSAGWIVVTVILIVFFVAIYGGIPQFSLPFLSGSSPSINREVVQMQIASEAEKREMVTVPANKLPEFSFDITAPKFQEITQTSGDGLKEKAQSKITYEGFGQATAIEADVKINEEKSKLIVHPKDLPNFKPGKYKLSLTLRTIEGNVNIEQDFTWGVIAVNTDKSIYKPGETAKIGFGVLDDGGNTQCMKGDASAEVWAIITDPTGKVTELSSTDGTIKDSGTCGAISVTNFADFQASYRTKTAGIYQMKVIASIKGGSKREVEDYFKVEENVPFEITRHDFPTRIYPAAPYIVSFKVSPHESYRGRVEEVVPAEFTIDKINKNGRVEDFGEFKKIVWDVSLDAGSETTFEYMIKFPMISPEFYLLGPIKIGTFSEARQWQIASDAINSSTGVVAYENNGGSETFSRVWTGTTWNPALAGAGTDMDTIDPAPADSRWFTVKSSPVNNEKIVVLVDNVGTSDVLWIYVWDGLAWLNEAFTISLGCQHDTTRGFDVAYEETSGDALLVYDDCTTQLKYRKRVNGAWDGSSSNAGTALDSMKMWVKLKSKPNTDDILIGYINTSERLGALIWDGANNTFYSGSQFEDDDSPSQTEATSSDEETFDIAWETQSGTPMMFWGVGSTNKVMYREYTSSTWQTEQDLYTSNFTNDVEWITASSDPRPTSDYIALAFQESDSDAVEETSACEFGMWNGSGGETRPSEVTCRSDFDGRLNNTAFENNSGKAMWVYVSSANPQQLSWRTWTSGGGFTSGAAITGTATSNLETVQLHSDLNTTSMIALTGDATTGSSDLNYFTWDGASWNFDTTDVYGNMQNPGEDAEAYGFGFDRFLETLAAYKIFANTNSTDVGTAYAPQDTPVTFTSANPDFRLRILLYIDPDDTVGINSRQYTLQYVDPGAGSCAAPSGGTPATWTDVGTGTSTLISYNDNATPTDGTNLTTNASDPTYNGKTVRAQRYEESNTFANGTAAIAGDEAGLWDLSLQDNTTYDTDSQTFCFRVMNNAGRVIKTPSYPQITTAGIPDVLIQGGSIIQGGTILQ